VDLLGTLAILAFLVVLAAAASPPLFAALARAGGDDRELEIWQVLRRRGFAAESATLEPEQMARAIRRCQLCASLEACRAWLAAGRTEGTDEFCPNDGVFRALDKEQRR